MNLLSAPKLHKRIADAVRLRNPREWRDAMRRRVRTLSPAKEPAHIVAWIFLRLMTAWLITLANRLPEIPPAAAAGINGLAVLWLLPRVQRLLEEAAACSAEREPLVFLPIPWATVAKEDARLRRRALAFAFLQCYGLALCICVMTGLLTVEPGVFWRGLISAVGLTVLMMVLGIIASILRGWPGGAWWKRAVYGVSRLAILTQISFFFFAVFKTQPPVSYEWMAKLTFWMPHGRLMLWTTTGGSFPWPDLLLCLVPAVLIWPAVHRVINPVPDSALPHPDSVPEPPRFTPELLADRTRRALRRTEFLDHQNEDEEDEGAPGQQPRHRVEVIEDSEEAESAMASELAAARPEAGSGDSASPEWLTAAAGLVRRRLEDPEFADPASMLVPALPPWSASLARIRSRLWIVTGLILIASLIASAGNGPLILIASVSWPVAFGLPFSAATKAPGGTPPALNRVNAGPGSAVPLYAWLPVDPAILRRNSDAWATRMVLSGTAFAVLTAAAAWLIGNAAALLCTMVGWQSPAAFTAIGSVLGPCGALQYFFLMTGMLLLSRAYQHTRLASAALKGFRAGLSGRFVQLFISVCSITVVAGTLLGGYLTVTGSGGAKPWPHLIWYLAAVFLAMAEVARYAGGRALDRLLRHARGEYRS